MTDRKARAETRTTANTQANAGVLRYAQDDGEKQATATESNCSGKSNGKGNDKSKSNGDCRSLHFASQRQERDAAVEMTELESEQTLVGGGDGSGDEGGGSGAGGGYGGEGSG